MRAPYTFPLLCCLKMFTTKTQSEIKWNRWVVQPHWLPLVASGGALHANIILEVWSTLNPNPFNSQQLLSLTHEEPLKLFCSLRYRVFELEIEADIITPFNNLNLNWDLIPNWASLQEDNLRLVGSSYLNWKSNTTLRASGPPSLWGEQAHAGWWGRRKQWTFS